MANESSKTMKLWGALEHSVLVGEGIDIGCGPDRVLPGVMPFDLAQGDANEIQRYELGFARQSSRSRQRGSLSLQRSFKPTRLTRP